MHLDRTCPKEAVNCQQPRKCVDPQQQGRCVVVLPCSYETLDTRISLVWKRPLLGAFPAVSQQGFGVRLRKHLEEDHNIPRCRTGRVQDMRFRTVRDHGVVVLPLRKNKDKKALRRKAKRGNVCIEVPGSIYCTVGFKVPRT